MTKRHSPMRAQTVGYNGKKITIEHLANLAPPAHLGAAAEIGAQNLADQMSREVGLDFPEWTHAHLPEVCFAKACFA
jgi:hypothetical protein